MNTTHLAVIGVGAAAAAVAVFVGMAAALCLWEEVRPRGLGRTEVYDGEISGPNEYFRLLPRRRRARARWRRERAAARRARHAASSNQPAGREGEANRVRSAVVRVASSGEGRAAAARGLDRDRDRGVVGDEQVHGALNSRGLDHGATGLDGLADGVANAIALLDTGEPVVGAGVGERHGLVGHAVSPAVGQEAVAAAVPDGGTSAGVSAGVVGPTVGVAGDTSRVDSCAGRVAEDLDVEGVGR